MKIADQAYQMYMQGMPHKEIAALFNILETESRHLIRDYAIKEQLPYPRKRVNHKKSYDLYSNGMSIKDIALYFSVSENCIADRIKSFCSDNNIELPYSKHIRPKVAYELRVNNKMTYQEIADSLGYENRSNCYRAIQKYKESLC